MNDKEKIRNIFKGINKSALNIPDLHKIQEINTDSYNLSEHGIDDLFITLTNQNNLLKENNEKLLKLLTEQETRASKSNNNWTLLTIIITIVLGIPAFVPLFHKDYTQELLLEIQGQRKLNTLKEQKVEQLHEKSIFLLDQLIYNLKSSKIDSSNINK